MSGPSPADLQNIITPKLIELKNCKRDVGNPINNTLNKTVAANFSASNAATRFTLLW